MDPPAPDTNYAELLKEMAWCGALAHRLTRSAREHGDEDATQEAWLVALRHRPRFAIPAARFQAWFRGLAWNRFRETRRSEASRGARERAVSRPEAQESVLDILERSETQRRLHATVMSLADPYRTTLLYRYFEGLSSVQIAKREGVSAATVRKRLSRAIEQLRVKLDGEYGDRRSWLAALLPLARTPERTLFGSAGLGAGFIGLASLAVIGITCLFALGSDSTRGERASLTLSPDTAGRSPSTLRTDESTSLPSTSPRVEVARPLVPRPEPAGNLHVRVLDDQGRALPGVALRTSLLQQAERALLPDAPLQRATSDSSGALRLTATPAFDRIVSDDPRYATLLAGIGRASSGSAIVCVLAPAETIAGRVVDADGQPVAGARITFRMRAGFGAHLEASLDRSVPIEHSTRSLTDGRFQLERVPLHEGARLIVSGVGHQQLFHELEPGRTPVELVLPAQPPAPEAYPGIVRDENGHPLEGALVSDGQRTVRTDASGRFELGVSGKTTSWTAHHPRYAPVSYTWSDALPYLPTSPIELHLDRAPHAIEGYVLDRHGKGVPGARVWVADPTYFGPYENEPVFVESLSADDPTSFWRWVETDSAGHFRLDGLTERTYRVAAIDPTSLELVEVQATPSTDIEDGPLVLTLPGALRTGLTGRVVDANGQPVPGAAITPTRRTLNFRSAQLIRVDELCLPSIYADEQGHFQLPPIATDEVELYVEGAIVRTSSQALDLVPHGGELTLTLQPRTHLQVRLEEIDADAFGVLDAQGTPLGMWMLRGREVRRVQYARIPDGRSHRWAVADRATTLVLYRRGKEVARHALQLTSGALNRVEL